jgi:Uma2 family endonuclease
MVSTEPVTYLTPQEYLEIERQAECKSEYYAGEMFLMSGGTSVHARVAGNVFASLHVQLQGRECEAYSQDLRVCVNANGLYTYPDVSVVCGEQQFLDTKQDTLLNPVILVEVLSPSTEAYDRGAKFKLYRGIESFREYVLVSQDRPHIDRFVRQPNGWFLTSVSGLDATVPLVTIDCTLALSEVYQRVEFPARTPLR